MILIATSVSMTMPTNFNKPQYRRPKPYQLIDQVTVRPILPPPNQHSQHPTIPIFPTNLTLPIPSPHLYFDNYHHPHYPAVLPLINRYATPETFPYRFPKPLGPLTADRYHLLGIRLHDIQYVDRHPNKTFTKWLLWYLEVSDQLIRNICPADLNDMPCEWDELQGGCPMLRLCSTKMKYPHPHLGSLPLCTPASRYNCMYIHDIDSTCRSIMKQLALPPDENLSFRSCQLCEVVADGDLCWWGHDFESARVEAVYNYWLHLAEARERGSIGVIKRDRNWIKVWKPIKPYPPVGGVTFHGNKLLDSLDNIGMYLRHDIGNVEIWTGDRFCDDSDDDQGELGKRKKAFDSGYGSEL